MNADLSFAVRSALARRIEEGGGVIFVINDSEDEGSILEGGYLFITTVPPPALPSLTLQASGLRWQP